MKRSTLAGFTLIELLIVVVVIGVLAAIAIPRFSATREKAFLATIKSDLKNMAMHQEIYSGNTYSYSTTIAALDFNTSDGVVIVINEATNTGWAATATHVGSTTAQCGMYYGRAAASGGTPATQPGWVAC